MIRSTLSMISMVFAALPAWALEVLPLSLPITGNVAQPSIVANGGDGFILTWQRRQEGVASLHFAELDRDGRYLREGRVAHSAPDQTWFVNWADFPSLTVLDNGDWVTYWLQKRSSATYAYDIHLTRSRDRGKTWSTSMLPHRDATASEHGFVSLVAAGRDRILAIWLDGRNTAAAAHGHDSHGGSMTLRSALIDRKGRLSEEFEIDARTCDCCNTDAARLSGRTLLLYRDRSADEIRDIQFVWRSSRGKWSRPALVHPDYWKIAGCPVNGPALAVNGKRAMAIWTTMDSDTLSVRFATGTDQGFGKMQVLEHGSQVLGRVDAAAWGKHAYLLSWVGAGHQATGHAIHLALVEGERIIGRGSVLPDLAQGSNPGMPRIASQGQTAIAVWTESKDGSTSIRAARISE